MIKDYELIEAEGMTMLAHKRINWREAGVAWGLGIMFIAVVVFWWMQIGQYDQSQQRQYLYAQYMNECQGHGVQYLSCERNAPPSQ